VAIRVGRLRGGLAGQGGITFRRAGLGLGGSGRFVVIAAGEKQRGANQPDS